MDNPWSSPWTTDDDPPKTGPSEPTEVPHLAFPHPVRFEVTNPASLWNDHEAFGGWAGGHGGVDGRVAESDVVKGDNGGNDGFLGDGLRADRASRSPSPSSDTDPWATEVSFVGAHLPGDTRATKEETLEHDARESSDGSGGLEITVPAPPGDSESPGSPDPPPEEPTEEIKSSLLPDDRGRASPGAISPTSPSGDAALTVQKRRDASSHSTGGSRQASKVYDLVVMYDGIARKSTEVPPLQPGPPKRTRPDGSPTPNPSSEDGPDSDSDEWDEFAVGDDEPPDSPDSTAQSPLPPSDPPEFPVDLTLLTTLFDGLAEEHPTPGPAEISDRLNPQDDFSTVAERKAWYRLSRQGSARLHNFGDAENYSRVAWQGSTVSRETFAIVRRWMQEGPILGGGRGGRGAGGMGESAASFGWDRSSSSDPVDLSFLTRKRPPPMKRRSLENGGRVEGVPMAAPGPTTGAGRLANGGGRPLSMPAPPRGVSLAPPVAAPLRPTAARKPSPLVLAAQGAQSHKGSDDEDEEWGEMVTSPQTTTASAAASDTTRADSAVSFGKSGSGSSYDDRPLTASTAPETPGPPKWRSRGGTGPVKPMHLGAGLVGADVVEVHLTPPRMAATPDKGMRRGTGGDGEGGGQGISRLPDLSYMLR
ncbi:uncharacterized protein DNG_09548 [Cephalotrichum gorgonifer]|uniref:Uncharacterized protein n=1 Tax=Cephalotrichum gorgonifer TaxID=2041049 RepID=A0AAE8SZG1_9PEZI|nr:uncharacterized protein DNG_09548 [Cephalotrichum gorgonifer]